ncbi:hypothetical protein AB0I77_03410 [Streptomyces sp. NPDC050619]|uniref:hypothetical protein n=1 Tax=Streptomyces sp. NPDC050619 TaxID=3157214 RepID=UPI003435B621
MRASPAVRALRAAVFAALCVLLAAGGHALATGMAPPVWVQAAGFVPVFAGGFLLGGRERSLVPIGGATVAAQGGLHLAYGAVRSHAYAHAPAHMQMSAHTHAMASHAATAHVSAALLLTWWLRRGEAALWSLLRRAVVLVPGLAAWWQVVRAARGVPVGPGFVCRADEGPRALREVLLRYAVHRRGPPAWITYPI